MTTWLLFVVCSRRNVSLFCLHSLRRVKRKTREKQGIKAK